MSRPRSERGEGDRRRRKRRSWARRKHLGLLTTGIALLVLVLGVVFVVATWNHGRPSFSQQVADAAPTGGSGAPTAATAPSSAASTAPAGPTTVKGTIATVADGRWTVTSNGGQTYTVVFTPTTTFPKKRPVDSFKTGNPVTVKGTLTNGAVTATSVQFGQR